MNECLLPEVNDTGDKLFTGVNGTADKFFTFSVDTVDKTVLPISACLRLKMEKAKFQSRISRIFEKFSMVLMGDSGARGKLIHKKSGAENLVSDSL